MKDKIQIALFLLIISSIVVVGISKISDKPVVFERVYLALYDGLPYYEHNYGYVPFPNDQLVYFRAYRCFSKAVVIFKAEKDRPTFSIIYLKGRPKHEGIEHGWIDDNCDGKFRSMNINDEAAIPECYEKEK